MDYQDKSEKIKTLISKNSLSELKTFFKENYILSKDFDNFNELLIYAIKCRASAEILEYIINARTDRDLNFEISYDNEVIVPLFEAIKNNSFDIADILIKHNANINYITKRNGINIYNYLYNKKLYIINNLIYILNNGYNIKNFKKSDINRLIEKNESNCLKTLFDYSYKNYSINLVLNLIYLSKTKKAVSNDYIKYMVNSKEDILQINDDMYDKAYEKRYDYVLYILFKYDECYESKLKRRIVKYDILERTLKIKDYGYIKKLLNLKPFNYKCMNYENILTNALNGFYDKNKKRISELLIDSFINNTTNNYNKNSNDTFANANYEPKYFNLVLNYAIKKNNMKAIKYLMENKAYQPNLNINVKDINNEYPLITALYHNQNDILKYLIEHGGDCNVKNNSGISLLILATQENNTEIVEYMLMKPNIQINEKAPNGYTALAIAINQNNTYLTELIIDYCDYNNILIDINEKDASGNYPIIKAINRNNFDMVVSLMEYGIKNKMNMNLRDINGYSLLYLSYKNEYLRIFKYLSKYLDINQVDCTSQSIIFYAVKKDDINTIKYLCNSGADINIRDNCGNSVIDYAIFNGNSEVLKILLQKDDLLMNEYNSRDETPLISLIKSKDFSKMEKEKIVLNFISKGCNIEKVDKKYNLSPLIHAVNNKEVFITKLLIRYGANVNKLNNEGYSYLRYGLNYTMGNYDGYYSSDIKKILFDSELNNLINDSDFFTEEIKKDNMYNIERVLQTVLDINMTNKNGNTLLHEAVLNKKPKIIKLLIEKGINKFIKNKNGENANDLNEKNNKRVTKYNINVNNEELRIYNEIHNLLQ